MAKTFEFGGQFFAVAGEAALYWPSHNALLVSDLHLEKASSYAKGGQMLPPYDSLSTLEDVASLAARHDVGSIYCLGDNFHDNDGERRLTGKAADLLSDMTVAYDWVWITGNHDERLAGSFGGTTHAELAVGNILLRHEAVPDYQGAEISGHFHPKFRHNIRGRHISRRCFVISQTKLIMPAFGALTGGMDAHDHAISKACGGAALDALVPVSGNVARFALAA